MLGPSHGYGLCRNLQEGLGTIWKLGRSQVYAVLKDLENEGLASHERVHQERFPPKKIYRITGPGKDLFLSWLNAPVNNIREMRLEFLTKLYFAAQLCPDERAQLISRQLYVCREKLDSVSESRRQAKSPEEHHALDFKLSVIRAAVNWLEHLLCEVKP